MGRKKLLAELELRNADSMEIHNQSFTKSDLIDYCEDLQRENVVGYHKAIEADRVLLGFLEDSLMDRGDHFGENDLYSDEGFIRWISPGFYASFTSFAGACFKQPDTGGLRSLLGNPLLMTDGDLEQSWAFIAKIIGNNIAYLQHYRSQDRLYGDGDVSLESVAHLMGRLYTRMIRLLPVSRFRELRDKYAFTIMQACIYTFNNVVDRRYMIKPWMDNAKELAVSPELKKQISDKQKEMRTLSGKKRKVPRMVRLAVVGVFIVARIISSINDSSSDDKYRDTNVYFKNPKDTSRNLDKTAMDSIMQHVREHPLK